MDRFPKVARTKQGCGCAIAVLVLFLGALSFVGYKFVLPWWRKQPPPASGKELRVHFLDVGQGDAILIISPDNKVVLVDAGDQTKGQIVVEALKRYNVQQIDYLIATHAHPDHIGGMDDVIKSVKVLNVLHNDIPPPEAVQQEAAAKPEDTNKTGRQPAARAAPKKQGKVVELPTVKAYNDFKSTVEQSGAQSKKVAPDDKFDLGGGAILTVLAPQPPLFTREQIIKSGGNELNANSIVMRLDYGDFSLLLAGDAEAQTEDRLTNKPDLNLAATVMKVAHHGSKYATSDGFLRRVKPEAAVISLSEFNRYGHPAPAVLERLRAAGLKKLYRTDLQGEITLVTTGKIKDGKLYDITAAKEAKSGLWAGREAQKDDSSRSGFITYGDFDPTPRQRKKKK